MKVKSSQVTGSQVQVKSSHFLYLVKQSTSSLNLRLESDWSQVMWLESPPLHTIMSSANTTTKTTHSYISSYRSSTISNCQFSVYNNIFLQMMMHKGLWRCFLFKNGSDSAGQTPYASKHDWLIISLQWQAVYYLSRHHKHSMSDINGIYSTCIWQILIIE